VIKYEVLSTNLPDWLSREIRDEAKKLNTTVTEIMRMVLQRWSAERRKAYHEKKKSVLDDI
jgi:hypothetical protein